MEMNLIMKTTSTWCLVFLVSTLNLCLRGSEALIPVQVVPQGIESFNGSDINLGCASPLVDRGGVMVCNNSESYLVDGCSPAINTSTSNWASQLVTVRKVSDHDHITFDHVLLTFSFNTAVSLTSIELNLFLCPEWGIGAPSISVSANVKSDLSVVSSGVGHLADYTPSQSSCDSLSTVGIPLQGGSSYLTWHILVTFPSPHEDIDWVHVGEVRFLNGHEDGSNRCTSESTPGLTSPVMLTTTNILMITSAIGSSSVVSLASTMTVPIDASSMSVSPTIPIGLTSVTPIGSTSASPTIAIGSTSASPTIPIGISHTITTPTIPVNSSTVNTITTTSFIVSSAISMDVSPTSAASIFLTSTFSMTPMRLSSTLSILEVSPMIPAIVSSAIPISSSSTILSTGFLITPPTVSSTIPTSISSVTSSITLTIIPPVTSSTIPTSTISSTVLTSGSPINLTTASSTIPISASLMNPTTASPTNASSTTPMSASFTIPMSSSPVLPIDTSTSPIIPINSTNFQSDLHATATILINSTSSITISISSVIEDVNSITSSITISISSVIQDVNSITSSITISISSVIQDVNSITSSITISISSVIKDVNSMSTSSKIPVDIPITITSSSTSQNLITTRQMQSTSVPPSGCKCTTECNNSIVIGVSVVSLLLIAILIAVVTAQCVLLIRMKSKYKTNEVNKEVMTLSTTFMEVPDSADDLFTRHKLTEKATFEHPK